MKNGNRFAGNLKKVDVCPFVDYD